LAELVPPVSVLADPVVADPVLADPVLADPVPPDEQAASRARAATDRPMAAGRREEPGIEVTQKRYKVCAGLAGQ
jgi:hypothetical protein